ncbi:MAG TPA: hypothetical protein VN905_05170 [Candidatus Binatia bacterium]|nr:hypothetical protein [Candidatus Binatia bacterium]
MKQLERVVLGAAIMALSLSAISSAASAGTPNLALSVSMNLAGGGPDKFSTNRLMSGLFGHQKVAELASLRKKFGLSSMSSFFHVSDFAVPDAMKIVQQKNMTLPDDPSPPPENTKALAAALYRTSLNSSGKVQAETLLDNLLSRPVRDQLITDIDAKFGAGARTSYFAVLTQLVSDLHSVGAGAVAKPHT